MIYFIQNERSGDIKIGQSKNVRNRLAALQSATPDRLILIGIAPGDFRIELELKRRFKSLKILGEWFKRDRDLLVEIKKISTASPIELAEMQIRHRRANRTCLSKRLTPQYKDMIWGSVAQQKRDAAKKEKEEQIRNLRSRGMSLRDIAETFGTNSTQVSRILRREKGYLGQKDVQ